MRNTVFILITGFLLAGCGQKSVQDRFIFSSARNGNSDLFLLDVETKSLKQLTTSPLDEWAPTVAGPVTVTFLRRDVNDFFRVSLNIESGAESMLQHPSQCILEDKNALRSPDGKLEIFQCEPDLYITNLQNGKTLNLTESLPGKSYKAAWFPDNKRIAFTYAHNDQQDIYSINTDGTGLKNLTRNPANEEAPDISPDGKYLLFSTNRDGNRNQELYEMELATGKVQNLTQTPDWELIGRYAPSGKYICWGSNKDGNWELYLYERATGKLDRVTRQDSFDGDPRPFP